MTSLDSGLIGAVDAGRPEHADFPMWLEKLGTIGGVKALRRNLHQAFDELFEDAAKPPPASSLAG